MKNKKIYMASILCALVLGATTVEAVSPAIWTTNKIIGVAATEVKTNTVYGTVDDFAVDEQGHTVWMLRKSGDSADKPLIQVIVTEKTKMNFEGSVGNGSNIGVEYVGKDTATKITAKNVNMAQNTIPEVVACGKVMEILPAGKDFDGGFRIRQFTDNTEPTANDDIIFRYDSKTKNTMTKKIKVGDELAITYNGILARSMPPQGFASIITDFNAPAVGVAVAGK